MHQSKRQRPIPETSSKPRNSCKRSCGRATNLSCLGERVITQAFRTDQGAVTTSTPYSNSHRGCATTPPEFTCVHERRSERHGPPGASQVGSGCGHLQRNPQQQEAQDPTLGRGAYTRAATHHRYVTCGWKAPTLQIVKGQDKGWERADDRLAGCATTTKLVVNE